MISVLCPTRGRPDSMRRLVESIRSTKAGDVEVIFYTDDDDPDSYATAEQLGVGFVLTGPRICMSDMWNVCAKFAEADVLMQCADDIVFRTPDWDTAVLAAFEQVPDRVALVYGNDLVHGPRLGTHPFVHRRWVDTVGYLVPPGFSMDWSDMWLNEVAEELDRRVYLPGVVTEHMHPAVAKGPFDQTHRERLARGRRDNVAALYQARASERDADINKLRAVTEVPT